VAIVPVKLHGNGPAAKPSIAITAPIMQRVKANKTRALKKPDRKVGFSFICGKKGSYQDSSLIGLPVVCPKDFLPVASAPIFLRSALRQRGKRLLAGDGNVARIDTTAGIDIFAEV
jgi:hypothetical protein